MATQSRLNRQTPSLLELLQLRLLPEGSASALRYLALLMILVLAAISLFPLYWALITSFKHPSEVATIPPSFVLTRPVLKNYIDLLTGSGVANSPVLKWFWNSVFTGAAFTLGVVLVASLAGYSFARKQFPGRDKLFWLIISTMLVPAWSTLIASYVLTLKLGMHDTYWALILPGLASPFALFPLPPVRCDIAGRTLPGRPHRRRTRAAALVVNHYTPCPGPFLPPSPSSPLPTTGTTSSGRCWC